MRPIIAQVPTNIITGFLGTGKTSTIQHLLTFKPEHERWAVLVNEFGTVGVDATLYQNQNSEEGGVFVREVPGGCMCCVSGLPMQIALNVLLKLSNPHRLFIEPSGLGHPVEVVSLLQSKHYQNVLNIQKTITVIDPQQLLQSRFSDHPTYQQQLNIADVLLINKADCLTPRQKADFESKIDALNLNKTESVTTQFGRIDPDWLIGDTLFKAETIEGENNLKPSETTIAPPDPIPEDIGYMKSSRSDEGYTCTSWRFLKSKRFSRARVLDWLKSIDADRIKGVFNTNTGTIGFNVLKGQMQIINFNTSEESKIEIISREVDPEWDDALAACLIEQTTAVSDTPNLAQGNI